MVYEEGLDTKDTWAGAAGGGVGGGGGGGGGGIGEGKNLLAVFEGLPSSMLAMIFYRYLTIG